MIFFKVKNKLLVAVFLLCFAVSLFAQSGEDDYGTNFAEDITNAGTSAAAFLEIGVGARAQSLGGAFTALANDASALYWNPAGIIQLNSISISANHTDWLAETNFEYFGLVFPAGNNMAFGLALTVLDYVDRQPVRTILQLEGTGEYYDASDLMIGGSFAMALTDRFSFGLSAKYVQQKIWHESAQGFAIDLGVLYRTRLKGLSIGTSISNFGTDMRLDGRDLLRPFDDDEQNYSNDKLNTKLLTDAFSLPLIFRFGLAYSFDLTKNHQFTALMDVIHPSNNVETMNLGLEYNILHLFALRAGYQSLFDSNRENGLTLGFGMNTSIQNSVKFSLNYAYSMWGLLGNVKRFSLDLNL
jgi:opacity protein-like surface antigen